MEENQIDDVNLGYVLRCAPMGYCAMIDLLMALHRRAPRVYALRRTYVRIAGWRADELHKQSGERGSYSYTCSHLHISTY